MLMTLIGQKLSLLISGMKTAWCFVVAIFELIWMPLRKIGFVQIFYGQRLHLSCY